MAKNLEHLAARVRNDPFFLACPLALFAKSEAMNEQQLAAWFHCSMATLTMIEVCRAPEAESSSFVADLGRVAARFSINPDRLVEAVRRGQAVFHMTASGDSRRTLMAARDADRKSIKPTEEGGQ
jgi:hypothetical protein